jgi:anti-sigma regulatory factor (Ser/Thr protein kinase)
VHAREAEEAQRLDVELTARPENLSDVRRAIREMGLSDELRDDVTLLTTELVSNSIRHAGLGPDDVISVRVTTSGGAVRVAVRDGGPGPLARRGVAASIRPSPDSRSGWGLFLVDRLASRWGTVGNGYGVWFELAEPRRRG